MIKFACYFTRDLEILGIGEWMHPYMERMIADNLKKLKKLSVFISSQSTIDMICALKEYVPLSSLFSLYFYLYLVDDYLF